MARITETVFVVASTTGSSEEFTVLEDAEAAQRSLPGSQIRTQVRERDVPAVYAVMVDGDPVSIHKSAREASLGSRDMPGSHVAILPEEDVA